MRAWPRAGEIERAENLANSATNPISETQILVDLTRHVGPAHAQRLVARVLGSGDRRKAFIALAELRPDVLTEVANALVD